MNAIEPVLKKLDWMQREHIWPNGPRYLWTDAFGVALYVSLFVETGDEDYLDRAEVLVAEVDRVLAPDGVVVWVNSSGPQTPIYLSVDDVVSRLPGTWDGVASQAGEGHHDRRALLVQPVLPVIGGSDGPFEAGKYLFHGVH